MIPKKFTYVPMPVGTHTIAPTIPNTKNEPRTCGKWEYNEIGESPSWDHPPKKIEQDNKGMKSKKENI